MVKSMNNQEKFDCASIATPRGSVKRFMEIQKEKEMQKRIEKNNLRA